MSHQTLAADNMDSTLVLILMLLPRQTVQDSRVLAALDRYFRALVGGGRAA
jgi:hypothetical protein